MKTHFLNFAAAALIVLAAASCNKEEIINTGGDGTKAIALSISIGEPGTKAMPPMRILRMVSKDWISISPIRVERFFITGLHQLTQQM